jgi:2',3'-cyclic-nucleotide 2'-phosphodiesterase (5'-nucleotidase family)
MKKIRQLLFGVIASIFAFGMMSCNGGSSKTKTTIDIYALNDFHGAFNYVQNSYTGLSRIGKYLMDEKAKNPDNTQLLYQVAICGKEVLIVKFKSWCFRH